jgi:hypothetical protein
MFDQLGDVQIARSSNAHIRDVRERAIRQELENASDDTRTPVQKLLDE